MNQPKSSPFINTGGRFQSQEHLSPGDTPLDLPDEEKSKNLASFSELAVSQTIQSQQMASTAELNGPTTDNVISLLEVERFRRQGSGSRSNVEMVYISKVSHQETDPGLHSGAQETITEENSPPESNVKLKHRKDLEAQQKSSSKSKSALKERKIEQNEEKKKNKEEKKPSFGRRLFKDTFKKLNKYRDRTPNKENKENKRPFDRAKSLADVALDANEMNEQEHEQINQVARTSYKVQNSKGNLAQSQCLDIAQEENPVSQGVVKVALDQSMRPAKGQGFKTKSTEEVALRNENQNHQVHVRTMEIQTQNSVTPLTGEDPFEKAKSQVLSEPTNFKALADRIIISRRGVTSMTDLLEPRQRSFCEKLFQFVSLSFLYVLIFYGLMPFGLFFLANDYGYSDVKIYLNFAVLGVLQALTEIILIHNIVDNPISKRIEEIEGENAGWINPKKYHIINKYTFIAVMTWVVGLQISAGIVIRSLGYDVNATCILVTMICISTIGAFLWFFIMLIQSPPTFDNKKKLLSQELNQIGEIRKNFMDDLHQTRINLDYQSKGPEKLRTAELIPLVPLAHAGAVANVKSNMKIDVRKFRSNMSDHSPELIKMRLRVIRIYLMMIFFLGQLLALLSLIKIIQDHNNAGVAIVLLMVAIGIGTCFGFVEFFTRTKDYLLSNMKIISMLVNAAVYRSFFFVVDDKGSMIGAVVIKFAYKILGYYVYFFHYKKADRIWKHTVGKLYYGKKLPKMHFFNSEEEKELHRIKPQRYILHKFIVLQNVDLFFGLGTIFPLACSRSWFPGLDFGFDIALSSFGFYLGVLLIESTADILIAIHFCLMAKKNLQKQVRLLKISILNEIKSLVHGRESVLIILEALVMYLLLFIFMNKL